MIADFFRGGSSSPIITELEQVKLQLLENLTLWMTEIYSRDRKAISRDLNLETWVIDDILNRRWGAFSADYILSIYQSLCGVSGAEVKNSIFSFVDTPGRYSTIYEKGVLVVAKTIVSDSILEMVSKNGYDQVTKASNLSGEIIEKVLVPRKFSTITLEFLILERLKLDNYFKPKVSLLDRMKFQTVDEIKREFEQSGLSGAKFCEKIGLNQSTFSLIKTGKISRLTLDKLVSVLDLVSTEHEIDLSVKNERAGATKSIQQKS